MLPNNRLESLLAAAPGDPLVMAGTLAVAFALGAAHALSPGHGKTVMAAYLAGSRGRVSDAIYLGAVVTVTHTASVFLLGLITLYASTHIAMDRIYPVLSLVSAVLVISIGVWLLWTRAVGHKHAHGHSHSHSHPHHHHGFGSGSMLSLGISGGLVPCPEALVVLMLSVTMQRIALGLAILLAFTLGLAAVLIAIGIAVVLTASKARFLRSDQPWAKALPIASAVLVIAIGVAMLVQSFKS